MDQDGGCLDLYTGVGLLPVCLVPRPSSLLMIATRFRKYRIAMHELRWWRLVTYMFLTVGKHHLIYNYSFGSTPSTTACYEYSFQMSKEASSRDISW